MKANLKIVFYICFIISLFLITEPYFYAGTMVVVSVFLLRIPASSLRRGWIPICLFLFFTFISNLFFSHGKILYSGGWFVITEEGLRMASLRSIRIFLMVAGAKILTATTSPEVLVDSLGNIMKPFGKFGIPVNDLLDTMGLTLRCFPRLKDYLAAHYRVRNQKETQKGFFAKAIIISSFLFPMFVQSMKSPEMFFTETGTDKKGGERSG